VFKGYNPYRRKTEIEKGKNLWKSKVGGKGRRQILASCNLPEGGEAPRYTQTILTIRKYNR